uniref:Transmembrane protein n=1 Tax=Medicago truncatula TaxID=3880 RepID=I3T1W4_MEDTR|nr:unknown [Medicago truncatula]
MLSILSLSDPSSSMFPSIYLLWIMNHRCEGRGRHSIQITFVSCKIVMSFIFLYFSVSIVFFFFSSVFNFRFCPV